MSLKRLFVAAACAASTAVALPAQAHAKLQSSDPAAGSTVASAPKQLRLTFNEALEPAFSKIVLSDAKQTEIKLPQAAIDQGDASVLIVALPPLASGAYRVQWTAMSHDSHKTKGEFIFHVK